MKEWNKFVNCCLKIIINIIFRELTACLEIWGCVANVLISFCFLFLHNYSKTCKKFKIGFKHVILWILRISINDVVLKLGVSIGS